MSCAVYALAARKSTHHFQSRQAALSATSVSLIPVSFDVCGGGLGEIKIGWDGLQDGGRDVRGDRAVRDQAGDEPLPGGKSI
jgi:hypothetical protein